MDTNKEIPSKRDITNWENIGKILQFGVENIPSKYIGVYAQITRQSIGYGKHKTDHKSISKFALECQVNSKTFASHITWLKENNYIKVITHEGFIEGGGSLPNAYSIVFRSDDGMLFVDMSDADERTKGKKLKKSSTIISEEEATKLYDSLTDKDQKKIVDEIKIQNDKNRKLGRSKKINLESYLSQDGILEKTQKKIKSNEETEGSI